MIVMQIFASVISVWIPLQVKIQTVLIVLASQGIGYRGGNIEDKVNEASIRKSKNFAAGTYPITYTERAQTPDRDSSFSKLKFKDNDGNDTNATFTATNDGDDQTTVITQWDTE